MARVGATAAGVKHGRLLRLLATELLLREPGQKLPTVSEFANKFDVGHGTIQRALSTLETMGAVRLESRGHLGTYVLEKDVRRLWEAAGTPVLLGGFPLPIRPQIRAIATALLRELRRLGAPTEVVYVSGSRKRLGQLRMGRMDFVVVSRFAAERAWNNQRDVVIVHGFGPNTYQDLGGLRLAHLRLPPQRVGVDRRSCEHYWRTVEVFPGCEELFVDVPYLAIPNALAKCEVDAALWDVNVELGFQWPEGVRFETVERRAIDEALSEACVVVLRENTAIRQLLATQVDVARVAATFEAVMLGRELPRV